MPLFKDDSTGAEFSPCRKYRYSLWRIWNKKKPLAVFICLNPSTADEIENDRTVRRCINYADYWGYGGMVMLNVFAFRSKFPSDLYKAEDPVGSANDMYINQWCKKADIIVIAWGNDGALKGRDVEVLQMLKNPYCLGKTQTGKPLHPLYLKKTLKPVRFL